MPRPKLDPNSPTRRLDMVITEAEIEAVDEWRWSNRVSSRGEAIRQLVKAALNSEGQS